MESDDEELYYDHVSCVKCNRNIHYNKGRFFCKFCNIFFYNPGKRRENRSRVTLKNVNKVNHFRKILNQLRNIRISQEEINTFVNYILNSKIERKDVDICIVEKYISSFSLCTDSKYHLLNYILFNKLVPNIEEINNAVKVFQSFIYFIHNINPTFTIKYDFYIDRIFSFLKINYVYNKKCYKDNVKKNKDYLFWNKFIRSCIGMNDEQIIKTLDYDVEEEELNNDIPLTQLDGYF